MSEIVEKSLGDADEFDDSAERLRDASGEAFVAGDILRAKTLALDAIDRASDKVLALRHAVWLFSSLAEDSAVLDFYRRLSAIKPLTASEHQSASFAAQRTGDQDTATDHALKALALEPNDEACIKNASALLISVARPQDASVILARAARADGKNAYWFRQLSSCCSLMGLTDKAARFSSMAWKLEPRNVEYGVNLAGLMIQQGEIEEAIMVLRQLVELNDVNGTVYWLLAAASCRRSDFLQALAYDDEGLAVEPNNFELLMNKGVVCCILSRFEEASDAFLGAIRAAPDNVAARRGAFVALTQAKRLAEATPIGAALIHELPDDDEVAKTFQQLLAIRLSLRTGEAVPDGDSLVAAKARYLQENPVQPRHTAGPLRLQARLIGALFLREMHTRFGHSKLGYLWAVFEPLAHIAIMVTLIGTLSHGAPPVGDSFAVFYFTGIIPYHLFTHTSSQLASAVAANRPMLQLPLVKTTDVLFSRALLEFATEITVAVIFIIAFTLIGFSAIPRDFVYVLGAVIFLWGAAFGVGMINAVVISFFSAWEKIWGAVTSILYFSSGTFYVPRMMPEWLRGILAWNPVLQGIEMVRAGYFHETIPPWLSVSYLATLSISLLAIGAILEYFFRARLLAVE